MTQRKAVTLIELLVVLTIISVLVGLLLPAVQSARRRARETVCQNNIHQINIATAQFVELSKHLPKPGPPDEVGGWTIAILPFLEEGNLDREAPKGAKIVDVLDELGRRPRILKCPVRASIDQFDESKQAAAHYVLIPNRARERFRLFEAPLAMNRHWATSPEMKSRPKSGDVGPHNGGFFYSQGFQQGAGLWLEGRGVR